MEFRAKTVEEAIEIGLSELNISKDDAEIEILQKSGLLKKAVVNIEKKVYTKATTEDIEESIVNTDRKSVV